MARADLLKRLFESYQRRDDKAFRAAAAELIEEERKKHHAIVAGELTRILNNGVRSLERISGEAMPHDPVPVDSDRRTPLLMVRHPDRYMDDLVLTAEARGSLQRLMREFRGWEILEAHGLAPTRRVLFCGPSGCGKTATAEVIAAELNLPLLYVRFDAVVSSLLGETAANLRKVFDYAERGQWVVLFDEFDAIGRSRDDATEHGEIKRVVNSFLQILDSFTGRSLVIAATNFEQSLDPAIWRRFDDVLWFPRPDLQGIAALVRKRLVGLVAPERLVERLIPPLEGASYADAERLCLDIRKSCALDGSSALRLEDIEQALDRWHRRQETLEKAMPTGGTPSVDRE